MKPSSSRWLGMLTLVSLTAACLLLSELDFAAAQPQPPDAATRKIIDKKIAELDDLLGELRAQEPPDAKFASLADAIIADVEIFHQAADWTTRHNEYYQKESVDWTLEALDRGLERANLLKKGKFDWLKSTGRTIVRGYRSRIDGSIQPYAVTLPEEYGDDERKWRLDVVLHGRDKSLNEIKFLHQFGDQRAPKDLQYIKIDIFGRGNNGYRWAGEMDILEVKANFEAFEELVKRTPLIDKRRQVLRGFSMGGAGTWHLGLHRPDKWCVLGPGAGFTTTHGYVANLPANLGWPQEQLLRIYDAANYAENVFNVPTVAYAGDKDAQIQGPKAIERALKGAKFPAQFQLLVAPNVEHQFPPEWQRKAEDAYAPILKKGRAEFPKRVRFVTYTLRYPSCDWVEILGMEQHYEKALVDAERYEDGFKVSTSNVAALGLRVPKGDLFDGTVIIDGQKVSARPWEQKAGDFHIFLRKEAGKWVAKMPQQLAVEQMRHPRKVSGLQGPIDDAFAAPFLCVRASGEPWSPRVDDYAADSFKRFQHEWAKFMRGTLPVKNDVDVTSEDIASKHLILFGDPGSNTILANVLDGLPLKWTRETLTFAGKKYAAATHVPVMIHPNPLNPTRYVVLNSGHTFHAEDYEGTNALLYPRLGDHAVLRLAAKGPTLTVEQVLANGLFDEAWKVMAGK